jgi:hypothetical protein
MILCAGALPKPPGMYRRLSQVLSLGGAASFSFGVEFV